MAPLRPRDVVLLWDRGTRPPKDKRHICVDPGRQLFLRINSKPIWTPSHLIKAAPGVRFIAHDSYVELRQLVRHMAYEISRAAPLGRLDDEQTEALCAAVRIAETLSEDHKDLIVARLTAGA
ncbi:MAG: hypothetical protein KIS96_02140 [Bauldia sp.]|nr:hypothetical protein [Bauldia sp.]